MKQRSLKTTFLAGSLLLLTALTADAEERAPILARACPFDCGTLNLGALECRDWRVGNMCYVEDLRYGQPHRRSLYRLCIKPNRGVIRVRRRCNSEKGETAILFEEMRGDTGPTGPQGPQGADGTLRIYGDGSAGARTITHNTTLDDTNPQYTNFTVNPGVTLTVHSGTVIRCQGAFINQGTIQVQPALRDQPRFAENGICTSNASSGGEEAPGGAGGKALNSGVAKSFLRLGLLGGGNGYREQSESSGAGGGNLTILCQGAISNSGIIAADGSAASAKARGGGGGGFIVLASATSIANTGSIHANGGDGGEYLATDANNTGHGPGGGGGGGVVHLIAPIMTATGTITVNGGSGGAAAAPGGIAGLAYIGGGGGGGAGGSGGNGGTVNPGGSGDNSTTAGENGGTGIVLQTEADPTSLF